MLLLFQQLLRRFALRGVRLFYKLRVIDAALLPDSGCLLVPNSLMLAEAILLQVSTPRRIRFLIDETIYRKRTWRPILHAIGALPVSFQYPEKLIHTAVAELRRGEAVCLFPASENSRGENSLLIQCGFESIAREAKVPVVPVWLDEAGGGMLLFSNGRYIFEWLQRRPHPFTIVFGSQLHHTEVEPVLVREKLMELGARCFETRPALQGHLGREALKSLARNPNAEMLVDGMDGSTLSRGTLLAAALALAKILRSECPEPRVAIVLPSGKGATLANLAVVLAGKVPVNLNFTAARQSIEAACRIADLKTAITARAFESKLPEFFWPQTVAYLEDLVSKIKLEAFLWRCAVHCLPALLIARIAQVPAIGDSAEAVTLFTSGSSGDPKGVVLSHRNLLGNVRQFSHMIGLKTGDSILACLPVFHSFGSTVNLWFPILQGLRMVTYPSPLDIPKNVELIERHNVRMLCSTPTFLRGYLRKADPRQLRSLDLVITGAEKLPSDVAEAFEARFGKEVLQGYGLTETSPVASLNLSNLSGSRARAPQPSNRKGSVGKLLPGMSAQIRDPETGVKLRLSDTGMLWLKGVNIFEGYLNDPQRTDAAIQDGWLRTGDLGRFDADGFLFIEGRLSRFSKIGGEMIPHETVEDAVVKALKIAGEERVLVITGIPDEAKGEALVLLSVLDLELSALRTRLIAMGLPNLWIPRRWVKVREIPHLASGKLDLQKIQKMASTGLNIKLPT